MQLFYCFLVQWISAGIRKPFFKNPLPLDVNFEVLVAIFYVFI